MNQIINDHFTKKYDYYKNICRYHFGGAFLFEDLLHETYCEMLKVKPETITFYHEIDKLDCIVIKTIKSLYYAKGRTKRYEKGKTSALFQSNDIDFVDINALTDADLLDGPSEAELMQMADKAFSEIDKALKQPVKYNQGKELSDYLKIRTFVEVNQSNINQVSKSTGISRKFLTRIYKEGQLTLQQRITK